MGAVQMLPLEIAGHVVGGGGASSRGNSYSVMTTGSGVLAVARQQVTKGDSRFRPAYGREPFHHPRQCRGIVEAPLSGRSHVDQRRAATFGHAVDDLAPPSSSYRLRKIC